MRMGLDNAVLDALSATLLIPLGEAGSQLCILAYCHMCMGTSEYLVLYGCPLVPSSQSGAAANTCRPIGGRDLGFRL